MPIETKKLGALPPKSDTRALMFARFANEPTVLPKATNFWNRRSPFRLHTYGNDQYGDCTRAKQAIAALRMERLETRRTPTITDEEVIRVYFEMTSRLYGGGDTGAYETDALSCWRKPDQTFKDIHGRPLTIDAFLSVNNKDQIELRTAIFLAQSHGIAVCLDLPIGFQGLEPPNAWDIPAGQALIGDWMPGSWGGHSVWARDYDVNGIWLCSNWGEPDQLLTWKAAAAYLSEAHSVVDSLDAWRTRPVALRKLIDLEGIKKAVNKVSSTKIE